MTTPRRLGALLGVAVLTASCGSPSATKAPEESAGQPIPAATTSTSAMPHSTPTHELGEPFVMGEFRVTLLSVQDPFASTAQVQPASGNRLVMIEYEMVSLSADTRSVSDLPSVEVRDSTGAIYQSAHGRLSVVGGSRSPGELPGGERVETSAVFEIPASATGLQAAFRGVRLDSDVVFVPLA